MLWEWMASALTRCAPAARALGYADELAAIRARERRCRRAWAAHLAASRARVLASARDLVREGASDGANDGGRVGGTLLVMGSGALLDLPLADLRPLFDRVVLADIAHPAPARRAARRLGVELATLDLTGTVAALARGEPPVPGSTAFTDCADLRLAVSLNLLSQLPLRPRRRWAALRGEGEGLALGRAIIQAHLDHLARLPAPVLLICDVWRDRLDDEGRRHPAPPPPPGWPDADDPLLGVPLPGALLESWAWDLAPRGEVDRHLALRTRVQARLLPGVPRQP